VLCSAVILTKCVSIHFTDPKHPTISIGKQSVIISMRGGPYKILSGQTYQPVPQHYEGFNPPVRDNSIPRSLPNPQTTTTPDTPH
jgi:hypothetical protein